MAATAAVLRACNICIMLWVHQHLYTLQLMHCMLLLYMYVPYEGWLCMSWLCCRPACTNSTAPATLGCCCLPDRAVYWLVCAQQGATNRVHISLRVHTILFCLATWPAALLQLWHTCVMGRSHDGSWFVLSGLKGIADGVQPDHVVCAVPRLEQTQKMESGSAGSGTHCTLGDTASSIVCVCFTHLTHHR